MADNKSKARSAANRKAYEKKKLQQQQQQQANRLAEEETHYYWRPDSPEDVQIDLTRPSTAMPINKKTHTSASKPSLVKKEDSGVDEIVLDCEGVLETELLRAKVTKLYQNKSASLHFFLCRSSKEIQICPIPMCLLQL